MTSDTATPIVAVQKECTGCGETKDLACFCKRRGGKYGVDSQCRVCKNATCLAWRAANPELVRELGRAWREANPERHRELSRAWKAANPERRRESRRIWNAANRDKCNAVWQHRNALKLGLFIEHVSIKVLMERDCRVCGICELQIPYEHENRMYRPSIDHIIPLSKGGYHSYANTQSAHLICNIRKGAKILAVA